MKPINVVAIEYQKGLYAAITYYDNGETGQSESGHDTTTLGKYLARIWEQGLDIQVERLTLNTGKHLFSFYPLKAE